jgi:hypothetical protein
MRPSSLLSTSDSGLAHSRHWGHRSWFVLPCRRWTRGPVAARSGVIGRTRSVSSLFRRSARPTACQARALAQGVTIGHEDQALVHRPGWQCACIPHCQPGLEQPAAVLRLMPASDHGGYRRPAPMRCVCCATDEPALGSEQGQTPGVETLLQAAEALLGAVWVPPRPGNCGRIGCALRWHPMGADSLRRQEGTGDATHQA